MPSGVSKVDDWLLQERETWNWGAIVDVAGDRAREFVEVEARFYDETERLIDTQTSYLTVALPGRTAVTGTLLQPAAVPVRMDITIDEGSWSPEPWLDDVRRSGVLSRLPTGRAAALITAAVRVVAALPVGAGDGDVARGDMARGDGDLARGDLASRVAGDAHALDDGSLLATIVLRAIVAVTGQPFGRTAPARRALWQAVGVQTDSVSTTVLTLGLVTESRDTWLDARTAAGWESHLTRRDLRRVRAMAPDDVVFVCENPRVLEFAMESHRSAPMVCTHGQRAGVVTTLLDQLLEAGATLRYHGDFDWPGIAIANSVVAAHGCVPWRLGCADFEEALARLAPLVTELPALDGQPVFASWEAELSAAMARAGRVVHEELVMDSLLADLNAPQMR